MGSTGTKKNKKRQHGCPQPGDPDYKTPTQLRNARKRRKLQRDKQQAKNNNSDNNPKAKNTPSSASHNKTSSLQKPQDPSLKYISDPKRAPTIQAAKRFFQNIFQQNENQSYQFPIVVGPIQGWRTVARLAVREQQGKLQIGLFVPGSHQLLPVPQCPAHHPGINATVQAIQTVCQQLSIQAFDETSGKGHLRYVAVSIERSTGKQQVVLVWKEDDGDKTKANALDQLIQRLMASSHPNDKKGSTLNLHSLWVHYNNAWKHANSIFDRQGRWEQRHGEDSGGIREVLLSADIDPSSPVHVPLYFPPQVFRQANLDGFSKIVVKIREWLVERLAKAAARDPNITCKTKNHRLGQCLELYGGVGTISLNLVDLFDGLESSDENPHNKACFESSVSEIRVRDKPLRESRRGRILYHSKSATEMVLGANGQQLIENADVIIVDPPRKGLEREVIEALTASVDQSKGAPPIGKALIYVSCGFDAFRRDYQGLTESGVWTLDHAEGHILFPGSDAIETLAFFKTRDIST